jgi:hypothetical protein
MRINAPKTPSQCPPQYTPSLTNQNPPSSPIHISPTLQRIHGLLTQRRLTQRSLLLRHRRLLHLLHVVLWLQQSYLCSSISNDSLLLSLLSSPIPNPPLPKIFPPPPSPSQEKPHNSPYSTASTQYHSAAPQPPTNTSPAPYPA